MNTEKIFAEGFSFKRRDNAPEFVIGRQSIKVDEAVAFLMANVKNGWVNLDIKLSQGGKYYMELDTWEANGSTTPAKKPTKDAIPSSISTEGEELPF
tara:strand:+ start:3250 stop:3540 length:291 start_codon:yes stop_codon:yes gene_type:complete